MQGWRPTMEDAHFAVPNLGGQGWNGIAAFGVLDGHGGSDVAKFCAKEMPPLIANQNSQNIENALTMTFYRLDEVLEERTYLDAEHQGCTACVCLVSKDYLICANAGDSRAVLCRGGRAVPLSEDHKPSLAIEHRRITRAGGCVMTVEGDRGGPRVQGDLNLSRSLGDLRHKQNKSLNAAQQVITCTPDVRFFHRQPNDEFMLLACDGVWDVLSNEDAISFIRRRLTQKTADENALTKILEDLLDTCLSPDLHRTNGLGGDNMTAVLVIFNNQDIAWSVRHFIPFFGCATPVIS